MVTEFECLKACKEANYNWTEWLGLSEEERAIHVAAYRIDNAITAHINNEHTRRMNQPTRGRRG